MKKQNSQSRNLHFLLALIAALLSLSFVTTPLAALAPITTGEAFEELTDPMQGENRIDMETIIGGETAELQADAIMTENVLEDGVYAFMNVGNSSGNTKLWMDLQYDNFSSTAHMQQYNTSTAPTESFSRSMLFKVTRVGTTNRYIIRLMRNNLLTFDFDGNYVKTKRIPANDSGVNISDTIVITQINGQRYSLRPYGETEYICANETTASGSSGAPNSYLIKSELSAENVCGEWEIHKYTGSARSGVTTSTSPSLTDGLAVGDTSIVSLATWSTVIGANTPYLEITGTYSSRATAMDISADTSFRMQYLLQGEKAGRLQLTYRIKNASNTNTYTAYQTYMIIPDFDTDSFYIQNGATNMYMDVEGPSTANGAYIQQWTFSTAVQKQWIVSPSGDGYFSIMSLYSENFVGLSTSDTTSVRQYSAFNDYTNWYFHETDSGRYAIMNKALGPLNRALATPSDTSGLGVNLTVSAYTNDTSYRDEWEIDSAAYEFILCGIPDSGHDHSSVLYDTQDKIMNYSCELDTDVRVYDTTLSASQGLEYLEDAAVFTIRCHGSFHSDSSNTVLTTFISLNNSTGRIYSHSYPTVPPASVVLSSSNDFSQLDLVLFVGCRTGEGGIGGNNLPTKAVEYGVGVAIGFVGSINCASANLWTQIFYDSLLEGMTVNNALERARNQTGLVTTVCGDTSYCLP